MTARSMKRLLAKRLACALACMSMPVLVLSQPGYPDKPVRLVVPYAPGGSTSVLAQTLGTMLGKHLGQTVFVDYRAGGNTVIGTGAVAKSPADGYTLLLTASSHVVVPLISRTSYDPIKDFTPIITVAKTEFVLVVNPSLPAQDLRSFIALAKAKPGTLTFASAGSGSGTHLVAEQFMQATGIKIQHVPYKGSGPLVNDLVGGQVEMSFQTPAVATQFITTRRLRALAVTGSERQPALADVPTLAESGIPNVNVTNWFGIVAPAGTPKEVVTKVADAVEALSGQPEFQEKLSGLGLQPYLLRTAKFGNLMVEDSGRMSKLVQTAKITVE
jgi:tripartite-type tricarboxylate transporter receptor subunit TctC